MFTNLSAAENVSRSLLSLFGKNTAVLMEIHYNVITVRRATDNAVIARITVLSPYSRYIGAPAKPGYRVQEFGGRESAMHSIEAVSIAVMAASRFPQPTVRERNYSKAVYREVAF